MMLQPFFLDKALLSSSKLELSHSIQQIYKNFLEFWWYIIEQDSYSPFPDRADALIRDIDDYKQAILYVIISAIVQWK